MKNKTLGIVLALSMAGMLLAMTTLVAVMSEPTIPANVTDICNVPTTSYPSIQSAVTDPNCAEVNIDGGTYYERVTIMRTVTVRGNGLITETVVDGVAGGTVFFIDGSVSPTITVTLIDLKVVNGSAASGGGVHNIGATLYLTDCTVAQNWASGHGGGLYNSSGKMDITNNTFEQNEANIGGGIYIDSGSVTVTNSTIISNEASFHAGGMFNGGNVSLDGVSVIGNKTQVDGGGIFNAGTMTINNSSINGNESTNYSGGGIRNEGTAYIVNTTVSSNKAIIDEAGIDNESGTLRLHSSTVSNNDGGGIGSRNSDVRMQNSIVSGNIPNDCRGIVKSDGYNLIANTSSCNYESAVGDRVGISANLGPLEDEPGYHPLLLGPGINAGNPNGCLDHLGRLLDTDQRDMPRVDHCDVGAYEYQGQFHQTFLPVSTHQFCRDAFENYFDDFSDPQSGWHVGNDAYVRSEYLSGEFRVLTKNPDYFYLYSAPTCPRQNYIVEVDARWVGKTGSSYGLLFGLNDDFSRYYLFDVNTDYQMYRVFRRDPGAWVIIAPIASNGAIRSDTAVNHLKVTRDGSRITLAVNGTVLGNWHDSAISGRTEIGIMSSPYNNQNTSDARFDNFRVTLLSSSTSAGAQSTMNLVAPLDTAVSGDRETTLHTTLDGLPNWNDSGQ